MGGWNKKLEGLELNPEETIHSLEFATSQEAWEKLNEGFLRLEPIQILTMVDALTILLLSGHPC